MKSSSKIQHDSILVGYVRAAHGVRGDVFLRIPSGEWLWAQEGRPLYLRPRNSAGDFSVFIVQSFRAHKLGLIVKFKEIEDRNQAESLKGFGVYVESDFFISEPGEKIFLNEVLGFSVLNEGQAVGEVVSFMETGAHDVLCVKNPQDKEHLIPFVEEFIEDIDFEKKVIRMSLPEGLLE